MEERGLVLGVRGRVEVVAHRDRPRGPVCGVEDGAAREHEVGTLGPDAGIGDAILVAPGQQALDHPRRPVQIEFGLDRKSVV